MSKVVMDLASDQVLAERARSGDRAAFEELYRRHVGAAWRLAQAVTRNADDASDAVSEAFAKVFAAMERGVYRPEAPFRPYLLTATRHAAIDELRKTGRLTGDEGIIDLRDQRGTPDDRSELAADTAFVSTAFASLPERWRSVLWLTEVEGMAPRQAAPLLGLSANSTAQLAVRARAGLRQRYLQAHLRDTDERDCKRTVAHLGAYAAGTLAARDVAKVDQHLAGCADCRERLAELEDVSHRLRGIILPLPLGLAGAAAAKWAATVGAAGSAGLRLLPGGRSLPTWAEKGLAGAAAAAIAGGIIGATLFGAKDTPRSRTELALPSGRSGEIDEGDDDGDDPNRPDPVDTGGAGTGAPPVPSSDETPRGLPDGGGDDDGTGGAGGGGTGGDDTGGGGGGGGGGSSAQGLLEATVTGKLGDATGGANIGLGGGDTGVGLGPLMVGSPPEAKADDGLDVTLSGELLGDAVPTISLP